MQQVFRAIGRLARSSVTVLITGNPAPARSSWPGAAEHSPRVTAPSSRSTPRDSGDSFRVRSCSGTSAARHRTTRNAAALRQADGGTCFLDEISDMSLPLQTRLLPRAREGEFYGSGPDPIRVDVRVSPRVTKPADRVTGGLFR